MLRIIAVSMSYKLDQEKHSRSFQNVSMTYAEVVREVVKDTPKAAAIFPIGKDRIIGKPLIQYKETDWEFFKRLASHFNSALVPDCRCGKPWFWFGMREDGQACSFSENEYTIHIADKYFKMGEKRRGFRRSNFFYYTVTDIQNCRIGDTVVYRKNPLFICEKVAEFVRGQIVFTYKIGPKSLIGQHEYYNEQFTGLSLEGTVVKTDHEIVHIHLDIDGERSGTTYPYAWKPISGNLMYCMPKLGTRASLFMPDHDERNARAADSPRVNGGTCPDMGDYNNRYLTTEHYKRMYWFPETMGLVGTGSESTPLQIAMSDEGGMLYESHLKTEIIARDCLRIEAPNVSFHVPLEMHMLRTSSVSAQQDSKLIPIGTGFNSPAPSGDSIQPYAPVPYDDVYYNTPASPIDVNAIVSQTILALQNMFPSASQITVYFGWEFCEYQPFDDAPKEGKPFDGWATFFQVLAGAAVAVILVAATGGLAAAAMGAVAAAGAVTTAALVYTAGAAACTVAAVSVVAYTATNTLDAINTQKATDWAEFWGMLAANGGASAVSEFFTRLTPVPVRRLFGVAYSTITDVGVDGLQRYYDNKSQEWSRTNGFWAEIDEGGIRHTDVEWGKSIIKNGILNTIFGIFDWRSDKKQTDEALEEIGNKTSKNIKKMRQDYLDYFNTVNIGSKKDELLSSCTTETQRKNMEKFLAKNADKPLSALGRHEFDRLVKAHPEVILNVLKNAPVNWKAAVKNLPSDLQTSLMQSKTKDMWDTIDQIREKAIRDNDEQTLMSIGDMIASIADETQRTYALERAYENREILNKSDLAQVSAMELDGLIKTWIPEG